MEKERQEGLTHRSRETEEKIWKKFYRESSRDIDRERRVTEKKRDREEEKERKREVEKKRDRRREIEICT